MLVAPVSAKPSPVVQIAILLLVVLTLVVMTLDSVWALSTDLAHHYALVARIVEFWQVTNPNDFSLGEMNYYPRLSHILAALPGRVFGSAFIGLQAVSLFAIALIWACFAYFVLLLPKRAALAAAAGMALLLFANGTIMHADLHGSEILVNYFYAQLVAQALALLALAVLLTMETRAVSPLPRYGVMLGAIYICANAHLLGAMQLLCFLLLQIMLYVCLQARRHWYDVLAAVALMLLAVYLLLKHPSYLMMREVSKNNGVLELAYCNSIRKIIWLCLLVTALSGILLYRWYRINQAAHATQAVPSRAWLSLQYLSLYGLAVAGLCLLQILLLKFGQGSEYAVKKHMFSLSSVLLMQVAVLPVALLSLLRPKDGQMASSVCIAYGLVPALTVLAFYSVLPEQKKFDGSDIVNLEHKLLQQNDLLQAMAHGQSVYVVAGPKVPNVIAYMYTIGILKTPRTERTNEVVNMKMFTEWAPIGLVLSWDSQQFAAYEACQIPFPALPLQVLDGPCIAKKLGMYRPEISFSGRAGKPPCKLQGFGEAEDFGRWSIVKQASLTCQLLKLQDDQAPRKVVLHVRGFVHQGKAQQLLIAINGQMTQQVQLSASNQEQDIELPLPANIGSEMRLQFTLPDARSPQELGVSADSRQLGMMLYKLQYK